MYLKSYSPNTSKFLGEVEITDINEVASIIEKATAAHEIWHSIGIDRRITYLKLIREKFYAQHNEIAKLISDENGKPFAEALSSEIIPSLGVFDYYLKKAKKFLKPQKVRIKLPIMIQKKSWIEFEPWGVVGIISPWNYPLLLPMGQIIPALIAGNSVIFKPSEFTPLVGKYIEKLFNESELQRNVFTVIYGSADVGETLVKSKIDKLFFTGSTHVGKIISKNAADKLLPISLELGGNDPIIVLKDADLDRTAQGIAWGALTNSGQTCVSVERVYVHDSLHDELINKLVEHVSSLKLHNGSEYYDLSALKTQQQANKVKEHLQDAIRKGAKIVFGGRQLDENKFEPTILTDVNHEMLVMKEETFGPIIAIKKVSDENEAIAFANDSDYGLSASVWTKNISRGKEVARKIKSGSVLINDCISYFGVSEAVVGGIKMSGTGRVHGKSGLMEMVYEKYYNSDSLTWQKKFWWFPYGEKETENMKHAVTFLYGKNIFKRLKAGIKNLSVLFKRK
jgi:succinate-semialdehyde dehydrogenase/glutarate-semialdehyde dehydrogenase